MRSLLVYSFAITFMFMVVGCNNLANLGHQDHHHEDTLQYEISSENHDDPHKTETTHADHDDPHKTETTHADHDDPHKTGTNHSDYDRHDEKKVYLTSQAISTIGLTIKKAKKGVLTYEVYLNGEVGPNEEKLQHIAPRFPGLVKAVYKKQGAKVRQGEKLALIQNNETLANYIVQSFYAGTIIEKHITVGEVVDNDQTLFVVADLQTLWINFDVYAKDEDKVKIGQDIDIEMVGSNKQAEGKINYVSQVYDRTKRSLIARVELDNRKLKWKPGAFVTGHIQVKSEKGTLLIDRQALQTYENHAIVFIPDQDKFFSWVSVKTGRSNQAYVEIVDGLLEGQPYVSQGAFELKSEVVTRNLGGHAGHGH